MHSFSTATVILYSCFAGLLVMFASASAWHARRSAVFSRECAQWMSENNTKSASMARIAELSSEMTEVTDALQSLIKQHKRLRSRIGMRNLRKRKKAAANGGRPTLELDLDPDPPGKKAELRRQAKAQGLMR